MTIVSTLFAFLAGIFSTLSPCVLPILPIVLAAAVSQHKLGPVALATGLALSFVAIGLFVASVGFSIGLDTDLIHAVAALVVFGVGILLLVPRLQTGLATAAGPISGWTERHFGDFETTGLKGQFALGLLLGAVWSPCVGPTLGAASILAAQGKDITHVTAVMAAFGVGAALPLVMLGLVSRDVMFRWRDGLLRAGRGGKAMLGAVLVSFGLLVFLKLDRIVETILVDASPTWLTHLTTQF